MHALVHENGDQISDDVEALVCYELYGDVCIEGCWNLGVIPKTVREWRWSTDHITTECQRSVQFA